MKTYGSKAEIFADFHVALKFVLDRSVSVRDYDALFDALPRECSARVTEFNRAVHNFKTQYPISVGFFVETLVKGDTGEPIGSRFVLLEHETGWEWFIPIGLGAAGWVGAKVADEVAKKVISNSLSKITSFMTSCWTQLFPGEVRIDHVEIRTAEKGTMRIPFSEFTLLQLECLLT